MLCYVLCVCCSWVKKTSLLQKDLEHRDLTLEEFGTDWKLSLNRYFRVHRVLCGQIWMAIPCCHAAMLPCYDEVSCSE